jgi:Domain of unknown function (DUF1906)
MKHRLLLLLMLFPAITYAQARRNYLGFDKNEYPGDELLPALHKTFAYTGYWLNDPPGMISNPWTGKRRQLREAGFGFLILFNGRTDAQLKDHDAAALGAEDARAAIDAGLRENFPAGSIIFLDQEEGGRLLTEQAAYIGAWIAGVTASDFRAGVYCSGIPVTDSSGKISAARDIAKRFATPDNQLALWVFNDQCPPAPGCTLNAANPARSGFKGALVWQYARSPRSGVAASCKVGYAADNNCYSPRLPHSDRTQLDLNTSTTSDPSIGR